MSAIGLLSQSGQLANIVSSWFEYPRPQSGYGHGFDLFDESIHVPLYVEGAGETGTVDSWVSTTDIVPTIMEFLEVSRESALDGDSLYDPVPEPRFVLSTEIMTGYQQTAARYRFGGSLLGWNVLEK